MSTANNRMVHGIAGLFLLVGTVTILITAISKPRDKLTLLTVGANDEFGQVGTNIQYGVNGWCYQTQVRGQSPNTDCTFPDGLGYDALSSLTKMFQSLTISQSDTDSATKYTKSFVLPIPSVITTAIAFSTIMFALATSGTRFARLSAAVSLFFSLLSLALTTAALVIVSLFCTLFYRVVPEQVRVAAAPSSAMAATDVERGAGFWTLVIAFIFTFVATPLVILGFVMEGQTSYARRSAHRFTEKRIPNSFSS